MLTVFVPIQCRRHPLEYLLKENKARWPWPFCHSLLQLRNDKKVNRLICITPEMDSGGGGVGQARTRSLCGPQSVNYAADITSGHALTGRNVKIALRKRLRENFLVSPRNLSSVLCRVLGAVFSDR